MSVNLFDKEFYPTPDHVIRKMVQPYIESKDGLRKMQILEPSAGNGAILDYISKERTTYSYWQADKANVYALERNAELQLVLQGKGYKMLGDDFLSYQPLHSFDLIIMNPPFSNGDEHLLHAWEIMRTGDIVCLLNAETINNPYTQRRQLLKKIVEQNGSVEMLGNCFANADRRTGVEVALVRLHKEQEDSRWKINFGSEARMEGSPDFAQAVASGSELAINDKLGSYLHAWAKAQEAAVEFIKARKKLDFYVTAFMSTEEVSKLVGEQLRAMQGSSTDMQAAYNAFLNVAKSKAWREIIANLGMDKYMTANLRKSFDQFCEAQGAYELNRENIYKLVQFVCLNTNQIMKKAVADVYDMFVKFHKDNAVIQEGWKTNSPFKVNKKVILPYFVETSWGSTYYVSYDRFDEYRDIDKVMCYLTGTPYEQLNTLTEEALERKRQNPYRFEDTLTPKDYKYLSLPKAIGMVKVGDSSLHESAFFQFRCYKKGTLHIIFKDDDLWAKFNLTVNEGKMELGHFSK